MNVDHHPVALVAADNRLDGDHGVAVDKVADAALLAVALAARVRGQLKLESAGDADEQQEAAEPLQRFRSDGHLFFLVSLCKLFSLRPYSSIVVISNRLCSSFRGTERCDVVVRWFLMGECSKVRGGTCKVSRWPKIHPPFSGKLHVAFACQGLWSGAPITSLRYLYSSSTCVFLALYARKQVPPPKSRVGRRRCLETF